MMPKLPITPEPYGQWDPVTGTGYYWTRTHIDSIENMWKSYAEAYGEACAAAEREACAAMFDIPTTIHGEVEDYYREVAASIRARGTK